MTNIFSQLPEFSDILKLVYESNFFGRYGKQMLQTDLSVYMKSAIF